MDDYVFESVGVLSCSSSPSSFIVARLVMCRSAAYLTHGFPSPTHSPTQFKCEHNIIYYLFICMFVLSMYMYVYGRA